MGHPVLLAALVGRAGLPNFKTTGVEGASTGGYGSTALLCVSDRGTAVNTHAEHGAARIRL